MKPSLPLTYARAKRLRSTITEAERRLWYHLRAKRLNGFKFYRQAPVASYIVDFVYRAYMLVVEVDGATHGDAHERARDTRRTAYLETLGFRILRVQNHDVFTAMDDVLRGIVLALEERTGTSPASATVVAPAPSPKGRGRK